MLWERAGPHIPPFTYVLANTIVVRAAQEVKALNSRVLEFLSKPQSVLDLVRHLVSPPTPDADQGQALRLPFAACEVRARPILAAPRDSCG